MKFHYVYRITNIILSKHYYGVRTSKIEPSEDIGIYYFSSSSDKEFIEDQKDNPLNYKYKVIKISNTRLEASKLEIKIHNKFNVGINESFYNRTKASSTGFDMTGTKNSKEHCRKISESQKGISKPNSGKHLFNNDGTLKEEIKLKSMKTISENGHWALGKPTTNYQKQQASKTHKGKTISKEQIQKTLSSEGYKNRTINTKGLLKYKLENGNPTQKQYKIYDSEDNEIFYISKISLKKFCRNNELPYTAFYKSFIENGTPLYQTTYSLNRVKKKGWDIYEGWYCSEFDCSK